MIKRIVAATVTLALWPYRTLTEKIATAIQSRADRAAARGNWPLFLFISLLSSIVTAVMLFIFAIFFDPRGDGWDFVLKKVNQWLAAILALTVIWDGYRQAKKDYRRETDDSDD